MGVAGPRIDVSDVIDGGSASVAASGVQLTPEQAMRMDAELKRRKPGDVAEPAAFEKRAAPARLRTLSQLLEDGLITQAEYDELRRKILSEL